MTHLINRLEFEVNCPGEDQAFQLRHSFPDTLQDQIMKAVDEVCSSHVPEEEWIQIDRLVINAGTFSSHSLYTEFGEVFIRKFEEELTKRLSAVPNRKRNESRQRSFFELLAHFLESGTLPWWASETGIDLNEISREVLAVHPQAIQQYLYANRFQQKVWTRVAYQLPSKIKADIISLFETLSKSKEQLLTWITRILTKIEGDSTVGASHRLATIDLILIENAPLVFRTTDSDKPNVLRRIFVDNVEKIIGENIVLQALNLPEILQEITGEKISSDSSVISVRNLPDSVKVLNEASVQQQAIKYTVKEAGIILLAPFLQQLFGKTGLYSKEGWESREAPWRAVHLLKYLGTGNLQLPEYTMVLEKLLCGLPLDQPVPLDLVLTEEEISQADQLLHSVLEHWKSLRSTSIQGLRETFFKRDGLLTRKENDWILQVERKTLDVLLDSLPWGYSSVMLPWNEYMINTEW